MTRAMLMSSHDSRKSVRIDMVNHFRKVGSCIRCGRSATQELRFTEEGKTNTIALFCDECAGNMLAEIMVAAKGNAVLTVECQS